jgi:hypothetical protein
MDYSQYKHMQLRRKLLKLFGAEISITDTASGAQIGFIKMKAWKLREDIRLYTDHSLSQEVMAIHARQIIDFGATYDVSDSTSGVLIFSLRRKGLRSAFVRDFWEILDPTGAACGAIEETSGQLALMRRWLSAINDIFGLIFAFVKQSYEIRYAAAGAPQAVVGQIVHQKNPIIVKMALDTSMAPAGTDGRLTIAAGALLSIMDAVKNR